MVWPEALRADAWPPGSPAAVDRRTWVAMVGVLEAAQDLAAGAARTDGGWTVTDIYMRELASAVQLALDELDDER